MVIQGFVVHLLEKQADSSSSSLSLNSETIAATPVLEGFVDDINKVYNSKANKVFGSFLTPEPVEEQAVPTPMDSLLNQYISGQVSFLDYSHQSMTLLKHYIELASKATGGYVVLVHYTLFGSEFMLIAMLNNMSGISVNSELQITDIDYLDIAHLHLAARIDLTQWQEEPESGRYISMIRTKESHKLSEYFRKFIGSDETIDSKQETSELFTAVNQFCNSQLEDDEQKTNFKKKAAEYCLEQAENGQNVVLRDFSNYAAEGAVEDFLNYVSSEKYDLNKEISPNKTTIRRFHKLSGRNAQVSITIDEDALGHSVIFDPDKETLTITELPASLKAQLLSR